MHEPPCPFIRTVIAASLLAWTLVPATAQNGQPGYRATPEAAIESLYNAVERGEYLRAGSYFRDEPGRPAFESFAKGYEDTEHVRLKLGESTGEGTAGSLFFSVPAAVESTSKDGSREVCTGCYTFRLVQSAAQIVPHFSPMGIVEGTLKKSSSPFAEASGLCSGTP